jgi:hypothetical protein
VVPKSYDSPIVPYDPYKDRSDDLDWLDDTYADGTPLDDEDIPILDEPPVITQARTAEGGPWYITADSGEMVPTDFYAGIDLDAIDEAVDIANEQPEELIMPDGKAWVSDDVRDLLGKAGLAGSKLLEALERDPNKPNPKIEKASKKRLRDAGVL